MRSILTWLILAALIEASLVLPGLAQTPSQQVAFVLLAYAVSGLAFAGLLWLLSNRRDESTSRSEMVLILAAGLVFRLTLFPLPPATSPDVHRYLWEGLVQQAGYSPYVYPPDAEILDPLAAAHPTHAVNVRQSSVHPEIPAVYPPTVQALFRLNAELFAGALWGWKLLLLAFDGLLALATLTLLRQGGQAQRWLAAVWWCPLLIIETYEGAHLDLVGVSLLTAALALYQARRILLAGVLLGLSINVKYLWPGLALVYLIPEAWRRGHPVRLALAAVVTVALSWMTYRAGFASAWETARGFMEHWRFNDLLFELLRLVPGPRWLPAMIAFLLLLGITIALAARRPRERPRDVWRVMGLGLLLSPVAYPWYFLWALPGLAGRLPPWLVVWVLLVPALHLVNWRYVATGDWDPMPWLWVAVTVLPAMLLLDDVRRRLSRAPIVDSHQDPVRNS